MLTLRKLFIILCTICISMKGYCQQRIFSPKLWLSNPKETKSHNQSLVSLNNYGQLTLDVNTLNSSINKIDHNNHLFLVYRSEEPENIISILGRAKSLFLNSDRIKINDSITVSGYNEHYGELLDVKFGGIENGRFWMNPQLQNTKIYEFILVNDKEFTINEIRTYLSLKYGIDLIDPNQYEYDNKQLWDRSDKRFGNHIFGIAKFSAFNLNLNKTVHSKDQDLRIAISDGYKKSLKDGNYILFGHNNKALNFNRQTKESNKRWLANTNMDHIKLDISVPLSKLQNINSDYKLIVGDDKNFKTYKGKVKDSVYIFKNVAFSKDQKSVLRINEIAAELELDVINTCKDFSVGIKPKTPIRSFSVKIKDDKNNVIYNSNSVSSKFSTQDISSRYYDVLITYNGQVLNKRITAYSSTLNSPLSKKSYELDSGSVLISLPKNQYKQIEWYKGPTKIGTENSIELDAAGSYQVKVTGEGGCSYEQHFVVLSSYSHQEWRVFPNPLGSNEDLNVSFQFEKNKNVDIKIFSIDGKLIKELQLGTLQNKTINIGRILGSSGTYMLVAYIDNVPQIQKIILK